jgi:hypothetical protein
MAWSVEGRYFENCSCEVVCPCTASLELGADYDHCTVALVFHVDSGEVDGVDVSGLTVAPVAQAPRFMHEGNWKLGLLIDDNASDDQAQALAGVFSGQLGGPMGALAPLVGEVLGIERVPMSFESDDGHHKLVVGDMGEVDVNDVVPFGSESGEPAQLNNVFHPAGPTLTIAKASGSSGISAFGLDVSNAGKSAFSGPFAWSG